MIFYLVTAKGQNAMEHYVNSWVTGSENRMHFLFYHDLLGMKAFVSGTYIFSDLERLLPGELIAACQLWEALSAAGPGVRLLNDPSRVLCRYDLLRKLLDEGKNNFNIIRARESLVSLHYPVFVREENEHTGSLTPLIHSQRELMGWLRTLRLQGYPLPDLLVVEFCDTSDRAGVFRKYSAFIVGGEIIPRHVIFSCHWDVKKPDLVDPHLAGVQEEYLNMNPHKSWLKETFRLSGIEYGRIDYSLLGDMPQVWEINTNPTVRKLTPRLTAAFESIDSKMDSGPTIPFAVDRKLAGVIAIEKRRHRNTQRFRKMVGTLTSNQLVRPLGTMMKSFVRYWSR